MLVGKDISSNKEFSSQSFQRVDKVRAELRAEYFLMYENISEVSRSIFDNILKVQESPTCGRLFGGPMYNQPILEQSL